jgi:hypothetical protein
MRQTVSSMALRSVYRLMSCGLGIVRDEALGMTAAVSRSARKRQSWLASSPFSPTRLSSGAIAETRAAAVVMSATLLSVAGIAFGQPSLLQSTRVLLVQPQRERPSGSMRRR